MALPISIKTINLAMTLAAVIWYICYPLDVVQRNLFRIQDKKEQEINRRL